MCIPNTALGLPQASAILALFCFPNTSYSLTARKGSVPGKLASRTSPAPSTNHCLAHPAARCTACPKPLQGSTVRCEGSECEGLAASSLLRGLLPRKVVLSRVWEAFLHEETLVLTCGGHPPNQHPRDGQAHEHGQRTTLSPSPEGRALTSVTDSSPWPPAGTWPQQPRGGAP